MKNFIIGLLFLCGFYACSSGKENISEVDCAQMLILSLVMPITGILFPVRALPSE